MNLRTFKALIAAALLSLTLPIQAEDIDLFVGVPPSDDNDLPNILFIIDNSANWNRTQSNEEIFTSLKGALSSTFNGLQEDSVRVGIMFFNESGEGLGSYVRAAIRAMTSENKGLYADLIGSMGSGGNSDQGNRATPSLAMAEAWFYYSGGTPQTGGNVKKTDYTGNIANSKDPTYNAINQKIYDLPGNALDTRNANKYNQPPTVGTCSRNYIIYLSNGPATNDTGISLSTTLLSQAGGDTATIRLSPSGLQNNPADEWARFMKQSSYDITTYTIEVWPEEGKNGQGGGQGPDWTAVLNSMANVSGGRYFPIHSSTGDATTASQIADAVNTILSEIQSVNSVYASVSLPVSVNTQGTYLNQVFIGMFRPSEDASPRWHGNLKQYKLGYYPAGSTNLQTLDATNQPAINSSTGFITECSRSFWTPGTPDTYWANYGEDRLHCLISGLSPKSNSPDGNQVEKGGHGFMLRASAPDTRKVYVISSNTSATTELSTSSVSRTQLGIPDATDAEHSDLINWIRGTNNVANDSLDGFRAQGLMRPSVHGDIVHSRPVAINFGSDSNPDVRVYYGGNDGLLRSIDGNPNGGNEVWAFLPQEFYGKAKRLRDNAPAIYYPGLTTDGAIRKDYGFDGPVTAYQNGDQAWIFASMRRGGRSIYAFDVTNKDGKPGLKWRIGCPGNSCTDADYGAIGQTWASPALVTAAGYTTDTNHDPILLVGGGYDTCEDAQPNTCNADSKGNRLYVIDAGTGGLLNAFTTQRGIVADVTPVKDQNGHLMYGYTADLGGNVYRLSGPNGAPIANYEPDDWALTRIASLGCDTTATCDENRKFMYAPDVVFEGNTYYLLLGSGDREKPIGNAGGTQNHFFMLMDRPEDSTWLSSETGNCDTQSLLCLDSLLPINSDATPSDADLNGKKGWHLVMNPKEQVVTSAITVFGTVTFSTHEPTPPQPDQCSNNLGIARVYNINYLNAAPANGTNQRSEMIPGGGLPPSPVAGMVQLDDGTTVPFIIGADPSSPLAGRQPVAPEQAGAPKGRVYWNLEE